MEYKVHMLVFPCTHDMGLEGGYSYILRVIHKSKDKKIKFNLADSAPTVTVIYHTSSGISFRVNRVLDIGVTGTSKVKINILNKFRSTM